MINKWSVLVVILTLVAMLSTIFVLGRNTKNASVVEKRVRTGIASFLFVLVASVGFFIAAVLNN